MKNFLKIKKNKFKNKTGFTLIEALIAITILTTSVVAPLSLASKSLVASGIAERKIVAYYLAQDAFEYVINKKLTNKLNSETNFLVGLDDCKISSSALTGCTIDTITGDVKLYNENAGKIYKGADGDYNHTSTSGEDTGYTRSIKIREVTSGGTGDAIVLEAVVEVEVKWSRFGSSQESVLRSHITNW